MNLKTKFKNYGFLMALCSALFLILQAIGKLFGFVISEESFMIVVNAILSCLVLLGFVTKSGEDEEEKKEFVENENIKEELKINSCENSLIINPDSKKSPKTNKNNAGEELEN